MSPPLASIRCCAAFIFSLFEYNLLQPNRTHFLGLQNYRDLIGDAAMRPGASPTPRSYHRDGGESNSRSAV